MILAIIGSRTFDDYKLLCEFIGENFDINEIEEVVTGGADGADTLGEDWANENEKKLTVYPTDPSKVKKDEEYHRNHDMINACDKCVAFWDGKSAGTKRSIDLCKEQGKECKICRF